MAKIPTPFIGGSEGPRRDRSARDEFAPPCVPGAEEVAAEDVTAPGEEIESAEEALEPAEEEASAAEIAPVLEIEALEPETPQLEVAVPVEWVDAEAESVLAEEAPTEFEGLVLDFEELVLGEEAAAETAPVEGPLPEAQKPPPAAPEAGMPDFLFGPDGGAPEMSTPETGQALLSGESPEGLAEEAERLLQGTLGERIRALIAQLGPHGARDAVARAFAAGYLAAKRREES